MSAPGDSLPVRLADGQVVEVPAMRLDWGSRHPRLIELMDWVEASLRGTAEPMPMARRLELYAEFIRLALEVSGYAGPAEVEASVTDVPRLHAALRGVLLSDPTEAAGAG